MELLFNCPLPLNELSGNQCDLCKHKVFDCTAKTDAEINLLATNTTKFCGIFKSSQINNRHQSTNHSAFKLAFLFVFILGFNEVTAATFIQQNLENSNQLSQHVTVSDTLTESPVLKGVITDHLGETVPFARVMVEVDTGTFFMTHADVDGFYKISLHKIPLGTIVKVTFKSVGLETVVVTNVQLNQTTTVNITLDEPGELLIIGLIFDPESQHIPGDPYDFGKQKVVLNERR